MPGTGTAPTGSSADQLVAQVSGASVPGGVASVSSTLLTSGQEKFVAKLASLTGLDPKVLLDIINVSSGRNSATQDKFPRSVLPGTFDFGFATALSYKDVRLCLDEAEAMGIPMIMGAVVRQILALTQAKYGPDSDFTSIAKLSEEWAGVQIRG